MPKDKRIYRGNNNEAIKVKGNLDKFWQITNDLLKEDEFKDIDFGAFFPILPALLDFDDADENRRKTLKKLSTKEGQAEFISSTLRYLLNCNLKDLGGIADSLLLNFVNKDWQICMSAANLDWAKKSGLASEELLKFFDDNKELFDCFGNCFSSAEAMTLDEYKNGIFDDMTSEEAESYIKNQPKEHFQKLTDLYNTTQRESRYAKFRDFLTQNGLEKKNLKYFLNLNFKTKDNKVLSGGEAFKALCNGEELSFEEKPQNEKDQLEELIFHPVKDKELLKERDQRIESQREIRIARQRRAKEILADAKKRRDLWIALKKKHKELDVRGAFDRVACFFLDTADTKEAQEKNDEVMRLLADPEGQIQLLSQALKQVFDLDIRKMSSTNPDVLLDFAKENWGTLFFAFDPNFIQKFSGIDPKLQKAWEGCNLLVQEGGNVTNMIKAMSLDEYPSGLYDDLSYTKINQNFAGLEEYQEIVEPLGNVTKHSYLLGLPQLSDRQKNFQNFNERLDATGFNGTSLLDFIKTKFVGDDGKELTPGRAYQNLIDKVGTVSGTEKSPEEKDEIDKMLLKPATSFMLKSKDNKGINAEDLINDQRKQIEKLPQASSLADYKLLLSVVLKRLPKEIRNDQAFQDAMQPLGDYNKFSGSKEDLLNLANTWDLLNDYANRIEEKNFADDGDLTLDKQIAQIRSIMTMLDNMELVAKQEKKYAYEHKEAIRLKAKIDKNIKIANDLLSEEEFKNIDIGGFASVLPALMKVGDSEEAMEQNRNTLRKLSTKEGRAELISDLMKNLFEVQLSSLGDTVKSNNLYFLNNDWPMCMLAQNLDWANTSDLVSDETYKLFKENQELFQCFGDCLGGVTGMTLDEFTYGSIDDLTSEEVEIYVKNKPGKNLNDLLKLQKYNQRNANYRKFNSTLEKMGLKNKSIKTFLSCNFKSEDGKVLSSAEAFKAISQGKILSYEQKPQEEKAVLEDLLNHPTKDKELLKERDQRIEKELKIRTERQKRAKALYNRRFKQKEILNQLEAEYQRDPKNKDNHYTKKEFDRVNFLLIDPSDTEEAKVKNKRTVELMHTPEGQIELYSNVLTSMFNLDIKKMSSTDPDALLTFAEENWDTLKFAFDPHFATEFSGIFPEVKQLITDCNMLIQEGGFVANMIEAMSLDEYLDGSMDDISLGDLIQKYGTREQSLVIIDPVTNQTRFSLMQGFGTMTNRQKSYQNFDERLETAGFTGTTLLDFIKTKFVGDDGKELTPGKAYQNLIDKVGTVSGTEKSLEEKAKIDEMLAKPAEKFILDNGFDAAKAVKDQLTEINKLAPATSLADYKMLLSQVLKKLPKEITNDKKFKDALKPLGDLKKFTGSEKDLQNLSKTWDLLDKYTDSIEQKMFDNPDLELDEQVAQLRSVMTMLDNMEIEAKQAAPAAERNAAPWMMTVLKKDEGIEAARNLMIASTKFLKYVDKDIERDAFKHELASIIVCDRFIKKYEKAEKNISKEEFMGGYNDAVNKLASSPMLERLTNNSNVLNGINRLIAVNSKDDPVRFNMAVKALGDIVAQSANEMQKGQEPEQAGPKKVDINLGK